MSTCTHDQDCEVHMGDCSLEGELRDCDTYRRTDHTTIRELMSLDHTLDTEIRVASLDGRLVIMSIYTDESGVIWLDVE